MNYNLNTWIGKYYLANLVVLVISWSAKYL